MVLPHPDLAGNERIALAAGNHPPMRRGERDRDAVRLLQRALVAAGIWRRPTSFGPDGGLSGEFDGPTEAAVRRFQLLHGVLDARGGPTGVVGRNTLERLAARTPRPLPPAPTGGAPTTLSTPSGKELRAIYQSFRAVAGKPCGRDILHQCAVRLSVALMMADCGFTFQGWRHPNLHSGLGGCGGTLPHVTRTNQLLSFLRDRGLRFEGLSRLRNGPASGLDIVRRLRGRKGIVYLHRCFDLDDGRGNHIDFWDGSRIMNVRLNYGGPGEAPPGRGDNHLFSEARPEGTTPPVLFCETP